jgi:hypothetical protein
MREFEGHDDRDDAEGEDEEDREDQEGDHLGELYSGQGKGTLTVSLMLPLYP